MLGFMRAHTYRLFYFIVVHTVLSQVEVREDRRSGLYVNLDMKRKGFQFQANANLAIM